MTEPALRVTGVVKRFGATTALAGVDLRVDRGEIHALLGENGAGKSTLIKILAGLSDADSGTVELLGTAESRVAVVHQELSLVPSMSVQENVSLGETPARFGLVAKGRVRERAIAALERVGLDVDPRTRVSSLRLAERQMIEIGRALTSNASVLLLDEPTSSLNSAEASRLFALLRDLAAGGTAIAFVSHRLDEVYELCSSATVLRDGRLVMRTDLDQSDHATLIDAMVGHVPDSTRMDRRLAEGDPALSVSGLRGPRFGPVDLTAQAGEIVGLAGLVGAGQTDFARALGGVSKTPEGTVSVGADVVDTSSPRRATEGGIAYVPADRHAEGLATDLSLERNAALPSLSSIAPGGLVNKRRARDIAESVVRDLDVRPARTDVTMSSLSGGNQQKVVVGKWLAAQPTVLVLDDPTRGVDVGARAIVHRIIRQAADDGMVVLLVSADLAEMALLPDRVLVFRKGRVVAELVGSDISEAGVLARMTGAEEAL